MHHCVCNDKNMKLKMDTVTVQWPKKHTLTSRSAQRHIETERGQKRII